MKDNMQEANSRYKCGELKQSAQARKIVGKSSSCQICVCVCFLQCSIAVFFGGLEFFQGVCVNVCVRSPVGLKLINLACFCLCIVLLSVRTTINP